MWPDRRILDLFKIESPILLAPMAGAIDAEIAIAVAEGLRYVYLGNVWGHRLEHTYCPECGAIAVRRYGFTIQAWNLDAQNRCRECGHPIPIVGRLAEDYLPTFPAPVS